MIAFTGLRARVAATCLTFAVCASPGAGRAAPASSRAAVCVDTSSPTAELDRRIATAALDAAGAHATIVPYDGSHGVSEKYFRALVHEDCALVMGFPVDAAAPDPPGGLRLTGAYFATGYVLASLGKPRTLATLPPHASVAVATASAPDFYVVGAFGHVPPYDLDVHQTQEQVLDALAAKTTLVAMAWGPSVAEYRRTHPRLHIATTPLPIPHGAWSLAALYDPHRNGSALRFERGLRLLGASGRLKRIARSVFPEVAS